jgi:hypothetical protein
MTNALLQRKRNYNELDLDDFFEIAGNKTISRYILKMRLVSI